MRKNTCAFLYASLQMRWPLPALLIVQSPESLYPVKIMNL